MAGKMKLQKRDKILNQEKCERCEGFGKIVQGSFPLESFVKCKTCKGKGRVSKLFPNENKPEEIIIITES